jgi:hypothetical protein
MGGQNSPTIAFTKNKIAAVLSNLFPLGADCHIPQVKATDSKLWTIMSETHSDLVGAPIADNSLTVWEAAL